MTHVPETAIYLQTDRIGLRAPLIDDAPDVRRWSHTLAAKGDIDSIERALQRQESIPWGGNPVITLVAVELQTGQIAGGVTVTRSSNRASRLDVTVAQDVTRADVLRDVLTLVVPWLLNEVGLMTVVIETPSDDEALIAAATGAGMVEAVRRREHVPRQDGRVDLLLFERVNLDWGRYAG